MAGDNWMISDELWTKMEPLFPEHKTNHPLGRHRKRVDNRAAMNAIFFVLRTGCQWNALNATGICSSSPAHRRFQGCEDVGGSGFGKMDYLIVQSSVPPAGHGCRWTAVSQSLPWQAKKTDATPRLR